MLDVHHVILTIHRRFVKYLSESEIFFPDPNFPNIWEKLYPIQNGGKERIFFKLIRIRVYDSFPAFSDQ